MNIEIRNKFKNLKLNVPNRHKGRYQDCYGNQKLFLDDIFITCLLAFYNALINSLRTMQSHWHFSTRKSCKSTLSDFNALADSARLELLIQELQQSLHRSYIKGRNEKRGLTELLKKTVAVDVYGAASTGGPYRHYSSAAVKCFSHYKV